jgi:hypothetical protein
MNAMNFAWTILKNEPNFEVQQYLNMTPGALSELSPDEKDHAQRLLMNYFMQQRGQGTGMEGVAIGTGTSTGDSMQPSSQVEKYDPSTYNQPGQALPAGQMPPKDPEMARRSRQQRTMEAGAERGRMQSQRDKVMGEMEEAGMTQDAMGALPFQELMRASKTPEGMARIQQMIRERRGAGAAGAGPQTDRIQMSEPMNAIDAAWAVLKSM